LLQPPFPSRPQQPSTPNAHAPDTGVSVTYLVFCSNFECLCLFVPEFKFPSANFTAVRQEMRTNSVAVISCSLFGRSYVISACVFLCVASPFCFHRLIEYACVYIYSVIKKDGLSFVRLYFLNYTWCVNDLHNI
jgi:hypothetical protein